MSKDQKLVFEWLRVQIKEHKHSIFMAIEKLVSEIADGTATTEISKALIMLNEEDEREILAELAKG